MESHLDTQTDPKPARGRTWIHWCAELSRRSGWEPRALHAEQSGRTRGRWMFGAVRSRTARLRAVCDFLPGLPVTLPLRPPSLGGPPSRARPLPICPYTLPRDPATSAATANRQRVSEGGQAPRPRPRRPRRPRSRVPLRGRDPARPRRRLGPATSHPPRGARPRPWPPARAGPGPHPRQGEVGHELLEGPRLLGLPLRVQRDLLTELPRVGAARARRGGHGAGPAPAGVGRRRARALRLGPPVRPQAAPAAARSPSSGATRQRSRRGPTASERPGARRGPPPRARPRPRCGPPAARPRPGSAPATGGLSPASRARLATRHADTEETPSAEQNASDVREQLGYHSTKTLPCRDVLAFGFTLQF